MTHNHRETQTKLDEDGIRNPSDRILIVRCVSSSARALSSPRRLSLTPGYYSPVTFPPGRVDLYHSTLGTALVALACQSQYAGFLRPTRTFDGRQFDTAKQRGRKNVARRAFYKCFCHIFGRPARRTGEFDLYKSSFQGSNSSRRTPRPVSRKSIEHVRLMFSRRCLNSS